VHRMPANSRHGILEALRDGIGRARIGVEVEQLEATAPDDRASVGQSPDKCIDAIRRQRAAAACASAETAVRQEQHRLVPIPALREPVHNADPPVHKRAPKGFEARESTRVVYVRNGSISPVCSQHESGRPMSGFPGLIRLVSGRRPKSERNAETLLWASTTRHGEVQILAFSRSVGQFFAPPFSRNSPAALQEKCQCREYPHYVLTAPAFAA
jgi:hypothetical protein